MQDRRQFLYNTVLGFLPALCSFKQVSQLLGVSESTAAAALTNEGFHFFDDSLANLHFYFVNADVRANSLVRKQAGAKAYMIVRLPQQHLTEQLYSEAEMPANGIAKSRLSGFSYLAFELFPVREGAARPKRSSVPFKIDNLMEWNNPDYFKVAVSDKLNRFTNMTWEDFKAANEKQVNYLGNDSNLEFYKKTCEQIFAGDANFPVTLLEIPQGMFLTPFVRQDARTITSINITPSNIKRRHYVYNAGSGRIHRSVRELWNASMFFEKRLKNIEGTPANIPPQIEEPVFRAVAYGPKETPDGSKEHWLPEFLDKQTLVYLTSLARKNADNVSQNADNGYDIKAERLRFTGLGAITRLYYRNFTPPSDIRLVEYEHHITLGRDEYIKVSEIGVISVTGQKALYVKIGQRKIKDGVAYVEYKEYIEIIQKEINYYNPLLFKEDVKAQATGEQVNYIMARKESQDGSNILHTGSFLDAPLAQYKRRDNRFLIPQPAGAPQQTHFRRLPFKKAEALTLRSVPIDASKDKLEVSGKVVAFWPVLESRPEQDLHFNFRTTDWSDQQADFSAPFMFIFKDAIDRQNDIELRFIYSYFFEANPVAFVQVEKPRSHRRKIVFNNQPIAYTPDDKPKEKTAAGEEVEQLSNKSNVAPTEFLDYYFSLAKDAPLPNNESIFNLRYFPLYPQLRRSKVYLENIKSYSPRPLPSVINYNEDFIEYAFKRGNIRVEQKYIPYNKAKLVFDHTKDFIENFDEDVKGGYEDIKRVFSDAGERIGGLVNPDIQIESVGLIRQGIAAGKELNAKYTDVRDQAGKALDKITRFNPRDLLKGKSAEILGGISLLDILEEVLPEDSTPMTEIKNFSARLEELEKNTIIKEIKEKAAIVQDKMKQLNTAIKNAEAQVQTKLNEVKQLQETLKSQFRLPDIRQLLENTIEESLQLYFLEVTEQVDINGERAINYFTNELLAQTEKIESLVKWLKEAESNLANVPAPYKALVTQAVKDLVTDYYNVTINGYPAYATVRSNIERLVKAQAVLLDDVKAKEKALEQAKATLLKAIPQTPAYNTAVANYKTAQDMVAQARTALNKKLSDYREVRDRIAGAVKDSTEFTEYFIQLTAVYELLIKSQLVYHLARVREVRKDIESLIARLPGLQNGAFNVDAILGQGRKTLDELQTVIIGKKVPDYITRIKAEYDKNRTQLNELARSINSEVKDHNKKLKDDIEAYLGKINVLKTQFDKIKSASAAVDTLKNALEDQLRKYETYVKEQLKNEGNSLLQRVHGYIKEQEEELRKEVNEEKLERIAELIKEAKRVLQFLAALSRQDITYTWNTSTFRDAEFGLLSFKRYNNPPTRLSVNVRSTLHYDIQSFPPVLTRMDYTAENVLSNFGISFFKAITVSFHEVSFRSGSNQPSKFNVKIGDVKFGGALSFVQAFESYFKSLLGDAFRLKLFPTAVNIGYTLPIPDIKTPSFNFFNLTFNVDFWLYFDKRPMEFIFSLARPDRKFGIVAGIYAGFGYFSLTAEPKRGITAMEVALEFGGYFGLSLGPLRGEVKLAVGLFYRKDRTGVIIEGYFICEGRAKLWFMMISVRFYMGVRSQGNYVEGRCTVTYSIRFSRFFKRSFTASYYKKLAGAAPANNQRNQEQNDRAIAKYVEPEGSNRNLSAAQKNNFLSLDYYNQYQREVREMDLGEWREFMNSFID